METTPLKVEFSDYDIAVIKQLANDYNSTATSALCRAINTEVYINRKRKKGTRFVAIDPDGTQYEVKF